ncbi:DUF4252 domain-containing protein [Belliella sp. DSM 111904]|uniref:DUF4252 domain-containing protein n=1 Tax=Belliella filtrata TaxID=2923435 RepID=A0ABS9V2T3_9BACT|nr:DUF4252 domain-containing protein [Belliella filtrata]MCH7410729.1 DUF4252 domain-containing protein [Belliella filtrata]
MKLKLTFIASILLLIVQSAIAQSKAVDALYQKHKSNPDFFHLDLGGNFMNFAKGFNIDLDEAQSSILTKSIEKMKFYKLPKQSSNTTEFNGLKRGLEKEKFELMMEVSEKSNDVIIFTKGSKKISDIVLLINDKNSDFIVLEFQGDFDANALADIGKKIQK